MQGYSADSDAKCPYVNERELWTEAAKFEDWHIGHQAKLDEEYKNKQASLYIEQQGMTGSELNNQPYLVSRTVVYKSEYNPKFGDDRLCECGHPYYRHFDWMEEDLAVGCKYCGCSFTEKKDVTTNS